jgi:proteasome accessory factor B
VDDVRPTGKAGGYAVPADHRAREMIRTTIGDQTVREARFLVRHGRGQALRRRGREEAHATDQTHQTTHDSWTALVVPFTDADAFADEVSGYGPDVVVEEPPEVRDLVMARLRGAANGEVLA